MYVYMLSSETSGFLAETHTHTHTLTHTHSLTHISPCTHTQTHAEIYARRGKRARCQCLDGQVEARICLSPGMCIHTHMYITHTHPRMHAYTHSHLYTHNTHTCIHAHTCTYSYMQNCPEQFDADSCGLFVCCFADCLSGGGNLLRCTRACSRACMYELSATLRGL